MPRAGRATKRRTASAAERLGPTLDSLVRLAASRRLHQRQASAAGVAVSQQGYRLLRVVVERGLSTPTELSRIADIDPAVVTRQTQLLETDGLIRRTRDDADRRLASLTATELGAATVARMRRVLGHHMELALESWDEADVETLAGLMERLVADLRAIPYPELPG